jgi:hypothetical protein
MGPNRRDLVRVLCACKPKTSPVGLVRVSVRTTETAPARGVSGNDKVFPDRAKMVLAAYLLAAALNGRGIGTLLDWVSPGR